jgi:hypothetical protein
MIESDSMHKESVVVVIVEKPSSSGPSYEERCAAQHDKTERENDRREAQNQRDLNSGYGGYDN